jgi:hypothetical protein
MTNRTEMYRILEADYAELKAAHDTLLAAAQKVVSALRGIEPLPLQDSIAILEHAISKAKVP